MSFPNLGKRLFFVLFAAPISWILLSLNFSLTPKWFNVFYPGQAFAMVVIFIACHEYNTLLKKLYPQNGFWLSYVWLALQFGLYITNNQLPFHLALYLLVMVVAIEAFAWGHPQQQRRWVRASLLFSSTAFLYLAANSLLNFYHPPYQLVFKHFNLPLLYQPGIILLIFTVSMCDTFAYFVGCTWGKHHFTTISPNKTIEGAIGGFLGAVIIATIGWHFLATPKLPIGYGVLFGVIIGIFSQLGDLFVSLMKRYFQVKDASGLLPGHGGVLDRLGSLFFTAPAISIFLWYLNRFIQL